MNRALSKRALNAFLLAVALVIFLYSTSNAASFVLSGNYLNVGVSESGGLIDDSFTAGIQFDPLGGGNYSSIDFLRPGTPFEFYSIGINGTYKGTAGYFSGNTFSLQTQNVSSGDTLSALSYGIYNFSSGQIFINQVVYFDKNSTDIFFSVQFVNMSPLPLHVVYARGLDPDQDVYIGGWYDTFNTISSNTVRAVGPLSLYSISIVDLTGFGVPSVDKDWDTDPYNLLIPHNHGNGDHTINMAWDLGTIDPFRSKEIDFKYSVNIVPVPATALLLGSGLFSLIFIRRRKIF